jgi:hypothetical protein
MTKRRLSRSVVALALSAAVALTGCDDADPDDPGTTSPGDTTVTTVPTTMDDATTTTLGEDTTTSAP